MGDLLKFFNNIFSEIYLQLPKNFKFLSHKKERKAVKQENKEKEVEKEESLFIIEKKVVEITESEAKLQAEKKKRKKERFKMPRTKEDEVLFGSYRTLVRMDNPPHSSFKQIMNHDLEWDEFNNEKLGF